MRRIDIVVPTVGRPSLAALLRSLDSQTGIAPTKVVLVDDRPGDHGNLELPALRRLRPEVVAGGGAGPAHARDEGWRRCAAEWVCFVDDDVVPRGGWWSALVDDLERAPDEVAAVQGRVRVPLPPDRAPNDRERNVAGLDGASWITADMAIRRRALVGIGGFDPRFPRAYREDTDLALRLLDAGWRLRVGDRAVDHPVGPSNWSASIRAQRGNSDDALMTRLHGPGWRERVDTPPGRFGAHLRVTAAAVGASLAAATGHPRVAAACTAGWAVGTARFLWGRVAPGPRDAPELARMAATSVLIPPMAVAWRLRGEVRARRLAPQGPDHRWRARPPELVLFDRDGTLVEDVPYNGDPDQVRPVPGAREALAALRRRGIAVGLVTNQSGVARGLVDTEQVQAVNERVADLVGPFDTVQVCPHGPDDDCSSRKPAPGMILAAARELGVAPSRCAVVGDIGTDVEAALRAGARPVLVPTPVTRAEEVANAPEVADDLADAVECLLEAEPARPREEVVA